VRGKAAEDDGVDRPDSGAGEHGDGRFRHHRHVDDDPIALVDALLRKGPREAADEVEQLGVGDRALRLGNRAVVDDGGLLAAAGGDVAVDGVVASVEHATIEPLVEGRLVRTEHTPPGLDPVDEPSHLPPESLRLHERAPVELLIAAHVPALPAFVAAPRYGSVRAAQRRQTGAATPRRLAQGSRIRPMYSQLPTTIRSDWSDICRKNSRL
jgi:hypothetical protein